jgi:hypothetical protein
MRRHNITFRQTKGTQWLKEKIYIRTQYIVFLTEINHQQCSRKWYVWSDFKGILEFLHDRNTRILPSKLQIKNHECRGRNWKHNQLVFKNVWYNKCKTNTYLGMLFSCFKFDYIFFALIYLNNHVAQWPWLKHFLYNKLNLKYFTYTFMHFCASYIDVNSNTVRLP